MTMRLTGGKVEGIAERAPDSPKSLQGKRPTIDQRQTLRGIFRVLDNGAKWKDLPRELASHRSNRRKSIAQDSRKLRRYK